MLKPYEEIDTSIKKDIIIDQMIKSNGVYLLVSNPKVGKSMLALQLSYSVTNGTTFLGYKVNPSPVFYINTESDAGQLVERLSLMGFTPDKNSLFIKDREKKYNISLRDLEYDIKCFTEDYNGKLIVLDMLKDIDFGTEYDMNNYQDISQKVFPILKKYCDKYNVTFLVTHHLNKKGTTLGSVALGANVDGTIILKENKITKKYVNLSMENRDFPSIEIQLKRNENLTFSVCNSIEDEDLPYELIQFIKYASSQKEFDFICSELLDKAKIISTPRTFGKLLNRYSEVLKSEGVYVTNNRTSDARYYHCRYEEPSQELI